MNAIELWSEFCEKKNIDVDTPYEAWAFCGGGPIGDELADLVLCGKKFGTASAYDDYVIENNEDEIPKVGSYSVILKEDQEAACVIKTYQVATVPFKEVSPFHAYSEGEGDRSLSYWREVHWDFFTPFLKDAGIAFTDESLVVCEKFSVEYIPGMHLPDDELIFMEPSIDYKDEIMAFRQELMDAKSSFDGCYCLKRCEDPEVFIRNCINWSNPSKVPNARGAKGNVIMAVRKSDRRMVGCFQVHNVLSERMIKYTGYVGYCVRPSERRKGYAKKILAKAKDFLRGFGFQEIFVSCLPDNIGSKNTILAHGGRYLDTVYLEEDDVHLERYNISLL